MNQLNMQEIALLPDDKLRLAPRELTDYLRKRLPQMATVAEKLIETGTPIEMTVRGLAFRPAWISGDQENDPEAVQEKLESLGVHEEVQSVPTRSYADMKAAQEELEDRVAYDDTDRKLRNLEKPMCPCCQDERIEEMAELEKQYGRRSLVVPNDYERGVLHGKLEAMRWMLGEDWESPEDRALGNQFERLLDTAMGIAQIDEILESADEEEAVTGSTCDHNEED